MGVFFLLFIRISRKIHFLVIQSEAKNLFGRYMKGKILRRASRSSERQRGRCSSE